MRTRQSRSGIALLMTLSVILILSIALMKTFESRSVETAHLANNLHRFQAETLSRSVLRSVLVAIKTKGMVFVNQNKMMWQGVPFPINNDQYFQIREIIPLDHLLNLNQRFRPDDPWPQVFANILNTIRAKQDPLYTEIEASDVHPVLAAINDWIDSNTDPDDQFVLDDYEEYYESQPEFSVKNAGLDRLSEVKLIPSFRELKLSQEEIQDNFRVFAIDKDSEKIFIDVNLATASELTRFIDLFKNSKKHPTVYDSKETLLEIVANRDDELGYSSSNAVLDPDPRFGHPIADSGSSWREALDSAGVVFKTDELDLFSGRSKHLRIAYSLNVADVIVVTTAIVEILYEGQKSTKIKGFEIISLRID